VIEEKIVETRHPSTSGWRVRRRALEMRWPEKDGLGIARALIDLEDALHQRACILDGVVNPASVWPDPEHEPEAEAIALERAADDVTARADELSRMLPVS
jgi:hypothetical protein